MKRVLILGAGVSGHTAASYIKKWAGRKAEVIVMTPNSKWNWIPSNIWVGVDMMTTDDVTFDLAPVYEKAGITFVQALAQEVFPEGSADHEKPFVRGMRTGDPTGEMVEVEYDYLINATGPRLNFGATEGLGNGSELGSHTVSVCTAAHAEHAAKELKTQIEKAKQMNAADEKLRVLIGTGNATCTCQGAAWEYINNVDFVLREAGVRDRFDLTWISNEQVLGDFGMGTVALKSSGHYVSSKTFAESLFVEKDINWITQAGVNKIEEGVAHYETLAGEFGQEKFDFAMLIPPFSGVPLKAYDKSGADISDDIFAKNGFMKVDADYTQKSYEEWSSDDWPKTYQSPKYDNMWAIGIAFAPPHFISKPMHSPNGTLIAPAPPRTGQPSGTMAHAVAKTVVDRIKGRKSPAHEAPMSRMGAACVASTGKSLLKGSAATICVYPVVPDFKEYPQTGRDENLTFGEIGLAGHWLKHLLHYLFIYKAKMKAFWSFIPD